MKIFLVLLNVVLFYSFIVSCSNEDDFSEFHDPDDSPVEKINMDGSNEVKSAKSEQLVDKDDTSDEMQTNEDEPDNKNLQEDDLTVETETEDSNYLHDVEEFEGIEKESKKEPGKPDLKIANVPHHLTTSWENYYLELLMIAGLVVYMANFIKGKTRNNRLANAWFESHKEIFEDNFSLVGDDGGPNPKQGELNKESENLYTLWCSGRVGCEGMLVELKLLKRQDLVSVVSRMMRPMNDQITIKVILDENEMEGFVMCLAHKKKVNLLLKEYQDLATFCPDKKQAKNGVPDSFVLLSEIPEASTAIIDAKVQRAFKDFEDNIEFMHISDQFTGTIAPQDDQQNAKLPEIKRCLMFGFKVGTRGSTSSQQMEALRPLVHLVLHVLEKVRRVRLGKEARSRSDRNRQRAMDVQERSAHAQRQEAAQARRAERVRLEKDRLMAEEDPDRARKLEQSNQKREARNKQPKLKMLKIAR